MSTMIYIARHAWAHEAGDPRWPDDSQRELEIEGAERYRQVIELLAARDFAPEVIATSPYVRCRQTADLISKYTPLKPSVTELSALEPGSNFEALAEWTRQSHCQSICWVGHVPDVCWLTAMLISDRQANLRFAKGAVAAVRMHGEIAFAHGELVWLATAKLLGV
jgi:phosphohistidine phosphatase SixA